MDIVVVVDSAVSAPVTMPVAASAPGIISSILDQNGSVNSPASPAERGSFVSLFGTGGGELLPQQYLMTVADSPPFPLLEAPVEVTIGGQRADVAYAGVAPLLADGVFQLNIRVPEDAPIGDTTISVAVVGVAAKPVRLTVRQRPPYRPNTLEKKLLFSGRR